MEPLLGASAAIAGVWASIEYRLRSLSSRVNKAMNREEVEDLIDLKQEPSKIMIQDIKEDVKEIRQKIDHLISLQLED